MSLSSLYLDAFAEVARLKSFSQAANKLHITQSALSQRVLNLESEIGSSLFIRDPAGVRLTELGQKLLRYCHSKELLEGEFMQGLRREGAGLSGIIRLAGFSTVNRSLVMPLFSEFLKRNPLVNMELRTEELRQIPPLLFTGAVDLALVTAPIEKQGIENHRIGYEENVLIQSSAKKSCDDVYLDHDEEDSTTLDFFKLQRGKIPSLKRNFLGEIYSIIDGVRLGMGRAVVPLHLIKDVKGIEVVKGHSPMRVPIYLAFYAQSFYTDLQKAAIELIQSKLEKMM